jgi:hypothetical protein
MYFAHTYVCSLVACSPTLLRTAAATTSAALTGALLLASLLLLPESPRWLVLRGQLDLALSTLHKIIESSGSHTTGISTGSGAAASALDGGSSSEQQVNNGLFCMPSSV